MDNNSGKFLFAIRSFLESFRVPGESQIISRVLECFARHYCSQVKEPFANADAAEILSYSVVMLNVDQHNPEVKHRMTENDFVRNNRGINGGKDLPPEMLKEIYHSIRNYEIKIPEEQQQQQYQQYQQQQQQQYQYQYQQQYQQQLQQQHIDTISDSLWRQVLNRLYLIGPLECTGSPVYDREIFHIVWGPLLAAISVGN